MAIEVLPVMLNRSALAGNSAADMLPSAVSPAEPVPLAVVDGGGSGDRAPESLRALDDFFRARNFAEANPGVRDERQAAIREDVRRWFNRSYPQIAAGEPGNLADYTPATSSQDTMLSYLVDYLTVNHTGAEGASWEEIISSQKFLDATFAISDDASAGVDLSQGKESHAFVVPVRLSTSHEEYSEEIRSLVHAFNYVPDDLVPYFMRDLPTFVADQYANGGQVVVAPVTDDMRADLMRVSRGTFLGAARARVNAAVKVGYALGARKFGYGATFPGLMNWGKATENKEVRTTTGHGGTTALISMIIDQVIDSLPEERRAGVRIGVIGLGKIGLAGAQVVGELHAGREINVFDINGSNTAVLEASAPGRFTARPDEEGVINNSDIIFSTATTTFELLDPSVDPKIRKYLDVESLDGKWVVDDSEPHSFIPEQVLAKGGIALEVVGRGSTGRVMRRTSDFGYGHTLADPYKDGFGCELEVATLRVFEEDLRTEGRPQAEIDAILDQYALRGPVTAEHTRRWIALFKKYGVGPAPFQAFGRLYDLS